ncbi:MAG TPA: TlpA disulfide reductase family protein [Acidimicrobiia bacterium]|nr:TlpA disulfide reductase family protein [Acidimicrobiia bacterium]
MTQKTKPKPGAKDAKSRATLWWILGGVVGLGLIVALAASIATEPEIDESIGYGDPTVEGDPLPVYAAGTQDVAIGLTAPTVTGADWEGNPVTIEPNGNAKIILFLAHWCPHCQNEVPVVQDWVDAGNLPEDVELISVVTSTDRSRTNWPPQDWLEEEGWTSPSIMDDQIGIVAGNFGMAGTPFYVVLDGENVNLGRVSGEIGVDGLNALAALAQSG